MSSKPVVQVQNLSKCYQVYRKPHERLLQGLFRGRRQYFQEFWALRETSFEVMRGETMGIVGRNGSGKTTLLQLICGTLTPTTGAVTVNGRVAALLALGAGFNPDFTGRENIHMYASLLGMTREEILAREDSICAFADIGAFIEQPVSTYSSGMYMRLAFAVAISTDPDVLVVDEALAVGDDAFRRKCHSRLEEFQGRGGTILLVTHSAGEVVSHCDRALLLDRGEPLLLGDPKNVMEAYHKLIFAPEARQPEIRDALRRDGAAPTFRPEDAARHAANAEQVVAASADGYYVEGMQPQSTKHYEPQGALIHQPAIYTEDGRRVNMLVRGQAYVYRFRVRFLEDAFAVRFGMGIKNTSGIMLGGALSAPDGEGITHLPAGEELEVSFRFVCRLNPGSYFTNTGVRGAVGGEDGFLHRMVDAVMFQVMPEPGDTVTGFLDLGLEASVVPVNAATPA